MRGKACCTGGMTRADQAAAAGPEEPGRRERKRRELRARLCSVALELFGDRGYEAVTMTDIAERADVARATVFNYFPRKELFLEEWGIRRRAMVAEILARVHSSRRPAVEKLRGYLAELAKLNTQARAESIVLMRASARFGALLVDPALGDALGRIVAEAQQSGEIRPEVDAAQAGGLLSAAYFVTVLRWADAEPEPFDLAERIGSLVGMVLDGLLS